MRCEGEEYVVGWGYDETEELHTAWMLHCVRWERKWFKIRKTHSWDGEWFW
jgi:hypothetical protein